MTAPAILALSDGTLFYGTAIGHIGQTVGEVVFNTAMTGYQEIISDPSYAQQLITFTYPHIGNVGCNESDQESSKVWASGLIIRDCSFATSNWRSQQSLQGYLQAQEIVAIADIDTRYLTQIIRDKGAQNACIATNGIDSQAAIQLAQQFSGLEDLDLAKEVTTSKSYPWREGSWQLETGYGARQQQDLPYKVVVYDYGVKQNILRLLVDRGCELTVVPAKMPVEEVLAQKPDGVFLSNGPGDPAPCDYAISAIRVLLQQEIPLFGICLGHQLLALASGAKTLKMKFGHHGANHPVEDIATKKVYITSQNHGFTVDEKTLPENIQVTHRSLFDGSVQGLRFKDKPALSFQGHPEASPGPQDLLPLFNQFISLMQGQQQSEQSETAMMANEG